MKNNTGPNDPIIVKKYANRRLYDTSASAYVTLDHLARLVKDGRDFIVQDAKTGEDLTRSVLTQIILEQENSHDGVLPIGFLRQIIQFYGESFQSALPAYLEMSMNTFMMQQEKWKDFMTKDDAASSTENLIEAQIKRNMSMFEDAMSFFTQSAKSYAEKSSPSTAEDTASSPSSAAESAPKDVETEESIAAMQRQLADMQRKISELANAASQKK